MWTRNNDVSNWNMLKHFIYLSSSKSTTSLLCSLYYRYSSKLSSFFCILSFLVRAISIDQTFYSATHYLAAVWLNSRHDFNIKSRWVWRLFRSSRKTSESCSIQCCSCFTFLIFQKVETFRNSLSVWEWDKNWWCFHMKSVLRNFNKWEDNLR